MYKFIGVIALCFVSFGVFGCDGPNPATVPKSYDGTSTISRDSKDNYRPLNSRFSAESQGFIRVGSSSVGFSSREVLILTDTKTGIQYLGIAGVGISELYTTGGKHKTNHDD